MGVGKGERLEASMRLVSDISLSSLPRFGAKGAWAPLEVEEALGLVEMRGYGG